MQNYRPFAGLTPAVKALLIANVAMWLLTIVAGKMFHVDLDDTLGLHLPQSQYGLRGSMLRTCLCMRLCHRMVVLNLPICFLICLLSLCSGAYWNQYGGLSVS